MINLRWPKSRIRYASNCYILSSCGECAIIDPTVPYSPDLLDGELKYIILTHCHFDHILEIDSWKNNTNAVVLVSAEDGKALSDPDVNCYRFFFGENKGYFGDYLQFKDGDAFEYRKVAKIQQSTDKLPLSFIRFQDRTAPQSDYRFILQSRPNIECAVSIFDASSEVIRSNRWSEILSTVMP